MHDGPDERASALLLVPAFLVIFVMIGGFVVDWSVAFLGVREAANAAAAGANDAAATALSVSEFQNGNRVVLDESRARAAAARSIAVRDNGVLTDVEVTTVLLGPNRIRVTVRAKVRTIFSRGLPYADDTVAVKASATASATSGGPP